MGKPKIVILGAGYGGLMTVTRLQKQISKAEAEIVLINKDDYHYETTWLHEASAGTLHHDRVRYPIKNVLNGNKVKFIQGEVVRVKKDENKVVLKNDGEVAYDYLVMALGSNAETFGIEGLKDYTFSITDVSAAQRIREHIERQFATYRSEKVKDDSRLAIVVGGAGFTGIEFLGELVNRIPQLCKEYGIPREKVRIVSVESNPVVLPQFDRELVDYALSYLESKGVEFHIGTAVKKATREGVWVGKKGEEPYEINAGTVIWSAGVRGNAVIDASGFENVRGRVKVNPDLTVPGYENIFMIGDCAMIINKAINRPYPPTAQIAMQHGEVCARNLVKKIRGEQELEAFVFNDKGTVCSLGEDNAIGIVFGKKLKGTSASFMKKVVDDRALFLIGGPRLVLKKGKFNFI
ncbi:NADH dehydrogenase-like protein YumB [Weizmannia acidilactici]|uniref:NADH dehydrogenase-like protein YumB n=1 Tax=Weizmannia acidilactici TaxID=2607726 RepID=A0A5J4JIP8_9BACI|nr:NAD(P)/FAD-dependent oxidoreductase [Weizmannia acidilactici]GER68218.1 NADH dehydrogenase-like protein YumB [Weizmannia acidilactici]GER70565.1 NADH dehydrogenase-like protein YumB [Weizmannia acidilactici]GER73148.1 NADH dehydrogenase-like protein YumB [Weizmannia acidilactici]